MLLATGMVLGETEVGQKRRESCKIGKGAKWEVEVPPWEIPPRFPFRQNSIDTQTTHLDSTKGNRVIDDYIDSELLLSPLSVGNT